MQELTYTEHIIAVGIAVLIAAILFFVTYVAF